MRDCDRVARTPTPAPGRLLEVNGPQIACVALGVVVFLSGILLGLRAFAAGVDGTGSSGGGWAQSPVTALLAAAVTASGPVVALVGAYVTRDRS